MLLFLFGLAVGLLLQFFCFVLACICAFGGVIKFAETCFTTGVWWQRVFA